MFRKFDEQLFDEFFVHLGVPFNLDTNWLKNELNVKSFKYVKGTIKYSVNFEVNNLMAFAITKTQDPLAMTKYIMMWSDLDDDWSASQITHNEYDNFTGDEK